MESVKLGGIDVYYRTMSQKILINKVNKNVLNYINVVALPAMSRYRDTRINFLLTVINSELLYLVDEHIIDMLEYDNIINYLYDIV